MSTEYEDRLVALTEFQRTRHFGKYRGTVTANDAGDEGEPFRIRAHVPAVLGDVPSAWALPALPFAGPQHGFALLPEVGDRVWIEFEGGELAYPIWSGCWWEKGDQPSPDTAKARLLATSAGHQILVDEDADVMRLVHPGGAEITIKGQEILIKVGRCELKITPVEITMNEGMAKVTHAGASLVNDALKLGG